jgi:CBS domain-containing protein
MKETAKSAVGHVDLRAVKIQEPSAERTSWIVPCPRKGRLLPLAHCASCEHLRKLGVADDGSEAFIECDLDPGTARRGFLPVESGQHSCSVTVPVSALVRSAACVSKELRVDALSRWFEERGLVGAPVVDEHGRLIGVVSKTDVVRYGLERVTAAVAGAESSASPTVEEIMTPLGIAVRDDATIADAAGIMSGVSIHTLPVVTEEGKIAGVVSAFDILNWIAARKGGL